MKKIGLIGGMSWESTLVYYKLFNELVKSQLGGFHSAKCTIESVDFAEIEALQHKNDWNNLNKLMVQSAQNLENSGADLILLGTNTMHLCSTEIVKNTNIPFIHIAETTGHAIKIKALNKVLLLGTKFTMEKDFYKKTLLDQFQIEVFIPNEKDRQTIHDIIYKELVQGVLKDQSKQKFLNIIEKSIPNGVQGVILGCTEIPLLIKQADVAVPIFNTTKIHAEYAVKEALQ